MRKLKGTVQMFSGVQNDIRSYLIKYKVLKNELRSPDQLLRIIWEPMFILPSIKYPLQ